MGLVQQARLDIEKITSNLNEWAVQMTFKTPWAGDFDYTFDATFNSASMFTVNGLHTKHWTGINEEGHKVNTKNASVTVSEQYFIDIGYPIRDANHEINMADHQVAVKDSTGTICTYIIREWFPDETIGLIVFILGDSQ